MHVEDIIKQLREKHGQTYTTEQLSCRAHMYNMEKHTSLEKPPKLPFLTGAKQRMQETKMSSASLATDHLRCHTQPSSMISPSKEVNLRSESIKQLVDWHSLLEKGGISKEQYDEVQQVILKDIKDNMV